MAHNYIAMFAVDGTIEARRARVLIIARSKATAMLSRASYHEHTGASAFGRSIDGKHGNREFSLAFGFVFTFVCPKFGLQSSR